MAQCEICGKEFLRKFVRRTTCSHKCGQKKYYRLHKKELYERRKESQKEYSRIRYALHKKEILAKRKEFYRTHRTGKKPYAERRKGGKDGIQIHP